MAAIHLSPSKCELIAVAGRKPEVSVPLDRTLAISPKRKHETSAALHADGQRSLDQHGMGRRPCGRRISRTTSVMAGGRIVGGAGSSAAAAIYAAYPRSSSWSGGGYYGASVGRGRRPWGKR